MIHIIKTMSKMEILLLLIHCPNLCKSHFKTVNSFQINLLSSLLCYSFLMYAKSVSKKLLFVTH